MCGIAGIIGDRPTAEELGAMGDALAHRGPDDHGILVQGAVGLAHTRLSLFDLTTAGHQPWTDGTHALVYNGEIYNFMELRRRLEGEGVQFTSTSDTEVLFVSIVRHGLATTLERIRGMFAFAFVDLVTGQTSLVRDRYGIKPLYYCHSGGRTLFASEVKAIATVERLDLDPIATLFSLTGQGDQSGYRTLFRGVQQVPPGHVVHVCDGWPGSPSAYATLESQVDAGLYRELDRLSPAEVTDRFDHLMAASVQRMLLSDTTVGVFVSGGVDSGLLAAFASAQQGEVPLYTADVVGQHSELTGAQAVAKHLKQQLRVTAFNPDDLLRQIAACTWHYEAPLVKHPNSVPLTMVSAAAKAAGTKAVLTGEGADELFLGYPHLATNRLRPMLSSPFTALRWTYGRVPGLKDYVLGSGSDGTLKFLDLASQGYERQQNRAHGLAAFDFVPADKRTLQHESMLMLREHLLSLLQRNDRMGMKAGLEARFPFLDEDVVSFGLNLPAKFKIRRTSDRTDSRHPFLVDKYVVRQSAARYVPSELSKRPKAGFGVGGFGGVKLKDGALDGSYMADLLRLDSTTTQYMDRHAPRYEVGKLFAVEVFARLFAERQPQAEVERWISDVTVPSGTRA